MLAGQAADLSRSMVARCGADGAEPVDGAGPVDGEDATDGEDAADGDGDDTHRRDAHRRDAHRRDGPDHRGDGGHGGRIQSGHVEECFVVESDVSLAVACRRPDVPASHVEQYCEWFFVRLPL